MVHNRVIISGTLGANEVWSTSLRFMGRAIAPEDINDTQLALNDWASDVAGAMGGTLDILRNCLSTSGQITGVQTQFLSVSGALVLQSPKESVPVVGLGTISAPYPNSVVITQQTARPGASYRGRNYWPLLAPGITGNGLLQAPTAPADVAGNWADLVNMITGLSPTAGVRPAVFSKKENEVTPVTSYRVGNVPDTQRRRRDALVETYSVVPA